MADVRSKYETMVPRLARNYRHVYQLATLGERRAGEAWYREAHERLTVWGEAYGLTVETVASVVAAISPQVSWENNLQIAERLLRTGVCTGATVLRSNAERAKRILADRAMLPDSYFKDAPKVRAFARNLSGDYIHAVTIDTHMAQAGMGDVLSTVCLNGQRYRHFERALKLAALSVSKPPAFFQATVWLVWKRLHPRTEKLAKRRQWEAIATE